MLTLSKEEKIILLSSRLNPSKEDIESIEQLVTSDTPQINYRELLQLAAKNGVAPLLYRNLIGISIFPDEVLSELSKVYFRSVVVNSEKDIELMRLLDLLKSQGIESIPLKGVIASELIFEDPGLYYGSDIDILVRPGDLPEVKQILIDAGYLYDEKHEQAMLSSHYHLVFQNGRHFVEVHWNLVKRYYSIPPEFWWEGIYQEKYNGQEISCLSPEKYLIYTIFRLFSHMFNPLKFFVLTSELCNKNYKTIDWTHFAEVTKKYDMEKLTVFTLKLSNELLGTKVPEEIIKKDVFGYDLFKISIINQLFRDVRRPFINKPLYAFLLDSPFKIITYFFKRFFPERGELKLRYGIPEDSSTMLIYYILNPILLPLLILKKRLGANHIDSKRIN
jgi:hypothetical protein